jgi:hypothetical protein
MQRISTPEWLLTAYERPADLADFVLQPALR